MRCSHCGMEVKDRESRCPFCGFAFIVPHKRGIMHIPVAVLVAVLAFGGLLLCLRISHDRNTLLSNVYEMPYRNLPIGTIFSDVLVNPEWSVSRDGIVFVEGDAGYSGSMHSFRIGFGQNAAGVYIRSMMIDGRLAPVDSVASIMDSFYSAARSL